MPEREQSSRWRAARLRLRNLDKVLYPVDRDHQGRGDALPTRGRAAAAAAAAGPAGDPQPLAGRRDGRPVLREEPAAGRPGLGPPGDACPRPARRRTARSVDLPARRRPGRPGLGGEPGGARAAHPAVARRARAGGASTTRTGSSIDLDPGPPAGLAECARGGPGRPGAARRRRARRRAGHQRQQGHAALRAGVGHAGRHDGARVRHAARRGPRARPAASWSSRG